MEFYDRVPKYPGRVRLTPVSGQANTYDMVRADEPIVDGTPVDKALFESFNQDIEALVQRVDNKLFEASQRVQVGDLVDGTIIGVYESGVLVPFIKAQNNYFEGRVLVVRRDCVTEDYLTDPGETTFTNTRCYRWLNNEYKSRLDPATQGVVTNVTILSLYEYYMKSVEGIPQVGSNVPYFERAERRIATLNGTPTNYWTRSIDSTRNNAAYITPDGGHLIAKPNEFIAGIRPAFSLPADFEVTAGVPSTANTMATAEVI